MNKQKIILLVEDDAILRNILKEKLQSYGFQVEICVNEKECRELFGSDIKPDIIVFDLMVPISPLTQKDFEFTRNNIQNGFKPAINTGLRLIKDIKHGKYARLRYTPLLIYSILVKEDLKREAENFNVRYFVKGVDTIGSLVSTIKNILQKRS